MRGFARFSAYGSGRRHCGGEFSPALKVGIRAAAQVGPDEARQVLPVGGALARSQKKAPVFQRGFFQGGRETTR